MAPSLPLHELLCFAVYSASHAFTRVYKPLLDELGLTYPQYVVLIVLWSKDDQTVGSLGQQLHLQSNTVTPLLRRMENLGYVVRRRDDRDERQVRVKLTSKGRQLRRRASKIPDCIAEATELRSEEFERLTREIAALRDRLLSEAAKSST